MVNDEVRAYYSEHHLLDLFDTLVNTTRSCPPKPVDVLLSSFLDNYGEQLSDEAITSAIAKLNTLQGRRQTSSSQARPPNHQQIALQSNTYHIPEINNRRLEQIMHSMFPVSLCKNIIRGEQNLIEEYPAATVLFADIVGFTQLSRESSPQLVLRMLIDLFNAFDLMTADVHIEKIKTVGDCYMAAAGVPISQPDHANIALRCGVRMLGIVGAYQKQFNTRLTIRVGVASGPVLGGIIGKSKLAFDIWGFTCNLASRMETTAPVYSVQFPKSTMELTQQEFPNIQSNTVDVKGVGTMDTYVLYPNPQQLKEMDCAQYLKHKVGVSEKFDSRFLSEMFGY